MEDTKVPDANRAHTVPHGAGAQKECSELVSLQDEAAHRRTRKSEAAGWTIKGVPPATIEIVRHAARERGMRIGAWVAERLHIAAAKDLGYEVPPSEVVNPALMEQFERIANTLRQDIQLVSEQNKALDQELSVIRRGLLPKLYEERK